MQTNTAMELSPTISLPCPETGNVISVYFEKITPAIAQNFLDKNHKNNRTLKERIVRKYAQTMAKGLWHPSSAEAIRISDDGILIDGQHRLSAIIRSGRLSITMMVITGIPSCAITAIDDGEKRSLADALTIRGMPFKGSLQRVSATINSLKTIQRIIYSDGAKITRIKSSLTDLLEFHSQLPKFNESIISFNKTFKYTDMQKNFSVPVAMSCWYLFKDINREATFTLLKSFETGTPFDDLKHESPSHHVMQYVRRCRDVGNIIRVDMYMNYFIWAFLLTIKNTPSKAPRYFKDVMMINDENINKMRNKLKAIAI